MLFTFDMFASHFVAMQVVDCTCLANRLYLLVFEEVETSVLENKVGCSPVGATTSFVAELVQVTTTVRFRDIHWLASRQCECLLHIGIVLLIAKLECKFE